MFSDQFSDFECDSFFDFGASPFGRQPEHRSGHPQQLQLHRRSREAPVAHQPRGYSAALAPSHPRRNSLPGYTFGLPRFDRLFDSVNRAMADVGGRMRAAQAAAGREDFEGRVHCQSAMFAYSSNGRGGEPQVYQAVSETRAGPGGVRETRKAVKDSRTRDERVAVGHHIGGRGHTVERRRNIRTGDQQEDHHYVGIDESEGQQFDREWDARAGSFSGWGGAPQLQPRQQWRQRRHPDGSGGGGRRAITDGSGRPGPNPWH